jgi:hypothetical protein
VAARSRQNRFREQLRTRLRRRLAGEGDQLLRRKRRERALSTPSSRDDNIVFSRFQKIVTAYITSQH